MTDVDALTAFIRARLDDEERDALAATLGGRRAGAAWRLEEHYAYPKDSEDENPWWVRDSGGSAPISVPVERKVATHVTRQDPAATLARVAALRVLVDACSPATTVSHSLAKAAGPEVLHFIAAVWRDHSDYQPELWDR